MKTKNVKEYLVLFLMAGLTFLPNHAEGQIGGIKVKNPLNGTGKNAETTTTSSDENGYDLYVKGNQAYDAGDYKLALDYYKRAEAAGYTDGEMTMKMRECEANLDSDSEKEAKEIESYGNSQLQLLDDMKYSKEPIEDQGMTNDFHAANVGKIVFSKTEIVKTTASGEQLGTSFSSLENVYARVYLSRSLTNEAYSIGTYPQNNFRYRISVNGQTIPDWAGGNLIVPGEGPVYDEWTTFQLALSPKAEDVSGYPASECQSFFRKMYSLPDGTHKVKIELVFDIPEDDIRGEGNDYLYTTKFGAERIVASGEFSFVVSQPGREAMAKKICPSFDYLGFHTNLVPDAFAMVDKSKREGEKVLKVVVYDNDWTYIRNGYGVITSRKIGGRAIIQDVKTKLCYEVMLNFYQENISSGGDKYGATTFDRDVSDGIEFVPMAYPLFLPSCIE